ncbi:tetratricopeptide repeat protein [Endozoicomonas sp. Mp262]|uniref:tetratricopeptide repeat protein n=1 Tax=Endozoicomonas sp. Mp262 TaxID=2919499 RepID=UPI0021DB2C42
MLILFFGMVSGCSTPESLSVKNKTGGQQVSEKNEPGLALYEGAWDESVQYATGARTSTEAEQLADKALQRNNMNKAAAFYARAIELDKKNASAGYKLANLHQQAGNSGQAEQIYRFVLKSTPRHIASLEGAGLILLKQNNIKEARRLLVKAVAVYHNQTAKERASQSYIPVGAYNGLGQLADIEGDYQKAQAYYQQGLEQEPESPELINNMAYSLYLSGDWRRAEGLLHEALSIRPRFTRAIYNLALVNIRARRYDRALELLERYMEPHEASNDVGYLAMMAGDEAKAAELFQNAIDSAPSYHEAAWRNMDKLKQLGWGTREPENQ